MPHLKSLDGVRGLAVLLVLLSHFSHQKIPFTQSVDFIGIGKAGVYLFFALSAFLLTLPFLKKGNAYSVTRYTLLNYFWRRVLRIYPLYLLILGASIITTLYFDGLAKNSSYNIRLHELLPHILLTEGKGIFWSIPVEFKYYFVLPLLAIVFRSLGGDILKCGALTLVLIIFATWLYPPTLAPSNTVTLGYYLPIFFLGSYTAVLYLHLEQVASRNQRQVADVVAFIMLIAALLTVPDIWNALAQQKIPYWYFTRSFMLYGCIWSLLILCALIGDGFVARIFSTLPIRYLGLISFSVYLLHLPAILLTKFLFSGHKLLLPFAALFLYNRDGFSHLLFNRKTTIANQII